MKAMSWMVGLAVLMAVATYNVQAGTLRVGEQDSCKVTGVTTIADQSVSFDLSRVKVAGEVTSAKLGAPERSDAELRSQGNQETFPLQLTEGTRHADAGERLRFLGDGQPHD